MDVERPPADAGPAPPLWRLLYRYFWPFQYFRDASQGSTLERRRNYRHNHAMRVHLPGFMLKWGLVAALWFAFGGVLDRSLELLLPAACCFVAGTSTLLMVVLLGVAWVWLDRYPELT
jgi:hypothetical protein